MIPRECKRLAEVDFPIAVVSKHAAREKSIRHGHPSTLHLWWARRPLAACRAMLLGLLLPDPCDEYCPEDFKKKARELLPMVQGRVGPDDADLRQSLLKFIGDFANWDLSADRTYIDVARGVAKAAHPEETPLVVDPFAGGGSIPLEALRLGADAFASDLNPVACLILKVLLEDIPRHGPILANGLRKLGKQIKDTVKKDLTEFYPPDPDGAEPIAYLWARTVRCEEPRCGTEIPLVRSFWLCKKADRKRALRFQVKKKNEKGESPEIEIVIFEPKTERDVPAGTVSRARASCPSCNRVLAPERVRAQLCDMQGGTEVLFDERGTRVGGARLLAVVTQSSSKQGRQYRIPVQQDYAAVWKASNRLREIVTHPLDEGISRLPDETLNPIRPSPNARGLSAVTRYGIRTFEEFFTARQKLALLAVSEQVAEAGAQRDLLAMVLSRCVDYWSSGAVWAQEGEFVAHTFGRQALAMVWDFAETVPWADCSGNFDGAVEWVALVIKRWPGGRIGQVLLADAAEIPLPDQASAVWFTDPPYYDAIPYADLADFFFVWLKRALPDHPLLRDPFDVSNRLTPKLAECVWNRAYEHDGKPKDSSFFEEKTRKCFEEGRRVLKDDGIGSVVFAHQTTEGWEALLGGLIGARWTVTASWPIATERASRVRARDTASLATSIHLVCRPRREDAPIGDWGEVHRELPVSVGVWMERLQDEGIRGADLVFACIGPALEIYSRYSKLLMLKIERFLWAVIRKRLNRTSEVI